MAIIPIRASCRRTRSRISRIQNMLYNPLPGRNSGLFRSPCVIRTIYRTWMDRPCRTCLMNLCFRCVSHQIAFWQLTQSTHHKRARVTGRSFSYQCPPVLSNDADMSCRTVHDAERVILEHSRRWEDPDGLEVATGDFTYRLCDRQTCV